MTSELVRGCPHGRSEMLTDEMRYRLMRFLQGNPQLSQRAAASQLGISVGKVNFCVRALARQGLSKARRTRMLRAEIEEIRQEAERYRRAL